MEIENFIVMSDSCQKNFDEASPQVKRRLQYMLKQYIDESTIELTEKLMEDNGN